MVSSIESSSYSAAAGTATPDAGIEAQLAKCQVQLADWISCPSGKTPEGKAKIATISKRVTDIKQRTKEADDRSKIALNDGGVDLKHSQLGSLSEIDQPHSSLQLTGSLGTCVDVYA